MVQTKSAVWPGVEGGRYAPLTDAEMQQIHETVLGLLESIGLSQAPPSMIEKVMQYGGSVTDNERLLFPRGLVERAIAGMRRDVRLYTRDRGESLDVSGNRVHTSTGGGTPSILDLDTREYRPSTSMDLFNAARLVDRMEHIHIFSRPMVCTDASNPTRFRRQYDLYVPGRHQQTRLCQCHRTRQRRGSSRYLLRSSRERSRISRQAHLSPS